MASSPPPKTSYPGRVNRDGNENVVREFPIKLESKSSLSGNENSKGSLKVHFVKKADSTPPPTASLGIETVRK